MFWGLIMEPQRRYTQTVKRSFHISMAALDISSSDNEPTQVMCSFEDRNYLLCTLQKGKIVQCPLDLNYEIGDKISFATNGNSHVHLTGYLTDEFDNLEEEDADIEEEEVDTQPGKSKKRGLNTSGGPSGKKMRTAELLDAITNQSDDSDDEPFSDVMNELDEEDDDDEGEEEEDEDGDEDEEDSEEGESEDEDEDDDDESEEEEVPQAVAAKKQTLVNGTSTPGKKGKNAQAQTPSKKSEEPNKSPKQDKVKTPSNDKKAKQEQKTPKDAQQQKKRTIEGGVIVEDLKQGDGQIAKPGKICVVYYEGRLRNNNKVFDSTNKGPGFKFRLGKQEVIKGWDVGINGMKVGGKRRITCPANMAYGSKGSPPAIPPNATLVFDVELKNLI